MKQEQFGGLSLNMVGDNETNFPHKLLLTNRQVFSVFITGSINRKPILEYS